MSFFELRTEVIRRAASEAVLRTPVSDTHPMVVRIVKQTRSLDQNAKFHAICEDMERAGAVWLGKPRTAEQWKVLLISAHGEATGRGSEMIVGLEGEFVSIRESSASMTKGRSSSLIEYSIAYCASNEILLRARR
jgi:hypothetical protein